MERERVRISDKLLNRKFEEQSVARKLGLRVYKKDEVDNFLMNTAYEVQKFEEEFATLVRQLRSFRDERNATVPAAPKPPLITDENVSEAAQQLRLEQRKTEKWQHHLQELLVQAELKAEQILERANVDAAREVEKTKEKVAMMIYEAQEKSDSMIREAQVKKEEAEQYRTQLLDAQEKLQYELKTYGDQLVGYGQAIKQMTERKSS